MGSWLRINKKIIIWILSLILLEVTFVNSATIKEININVIDTDSLKLLYIPFDNPKQIGTSKFNKFLNKIYPLSDEGLVSIVAQYEYSTDAPFRDIPKPYGQVDLNVLIFNVYVRNKIGGTDFNRLALITPNDWFEKNTKNEFKNYTGFSTVLGTPVILVEEETGRHSVAHEIGHTYGLCEEYDNDAWTKQNRVLLPWGGCGNSIDDSCLDEITGCDAYTFREVNPFLGGNGEIRLYNFIGWDTNESERWVSKETYNHLLSKFKKKDVQPLENVVLVKGSINKDGTVKLDDAYGLKGGFITTQQELIPGEFSIKTLDVNDNEIYDLNFTPSFVLAFIGGPTIELDEATFVFALPFTPETEKIVIEEEGIVKAEQVRTPNVPVVSVVSPNGGEVFSSDFLVEWEAFDADDDVLSYAILFSNDNGNSWSTLVFDYDDTSYLVNVSYLDEGDKYLVKVLATDGINTGEDVSDSTFSIVHEEEVRRI